MENFTKEITYLFTKVWVWLLCIFLGLMAKYSYDIITGKRITLLQALASAGIAFFVGFLASVWCVINDMEREGMWIVPIATLLSEKVIMAMLTIEVSDIRKFLSDIAQYFADKFKK